MNDVGVESGTRGGWDRWRLPAITTRSAAVTPCRSGHPCMRRAIRSAMVPQVIRRVAWSVTFHHNVTG